MAATEDGPDHGGRLGPLYYLREHMLVSPFGQPAAAGVSAHLWYEWDMSSAKDCFQEQGLSTPAWLLRDITQDTAQSRRRCAALTDALGLRSVGWETRAS
jgi:hypothetical protein